MAAPAVKLPVIVVPKTGLAPIPGAKDQLAALTKNLKGPGNRQSSRGGRTRRFKMPRLMSRKYCKKTPCRRMGFTQRSSCRPYKNCFNGGSRSRRA